MFFSFTKLFEDFLFYRWIAASPGEKNPCLESASRFSVKLFPGDATYLACDAPSTMWKHNGKLVESSSTIHLTTQGGLVLLNVCLVLPVVPYFSNSTEFINITLFFFFAIHS